MSVRHPVTPDCGAADCRKAARSLGLCAEHRALLPDAAGTAAHRAIMGATLAATSAARAAAAAQVNAILAAAAPAREALTVS